MNSQTMMIWAVVLIVFKFLKADGFQVVKVDMDPETQTFKFAPLNRNSTPGTLVGIVQAVLSNEVLKYSLIDVTKDGQSSPKNVTWQNRAKRLTEDDCSEETLNFYPNPRKQFCINHNTGEIFTTKYFSQVEPESGTFYKFQIRYDAVGPFTRSSEAISPHSVDIYSNCDHLKNIYDTMSGTCSQEKLVITIGDQLELKSHLSISFNVNGIDLAYITALKVDFSRAAGNGITFEIGDMVTFDISNENFNTKASLVYLSSKSIHISYVQAPARVSKGGTFRISAEKTPVNSTLTQKINLYPAMLKIIFMERKDYCLSSASSSCNISLANEYYQQLVKNQEECINIDEQNFYAKFGYCKANPPPEFTKNTVIVDWDALQYDDSLVSVLTNYISNIQGKDVDIKIMTVTSAQQNTDQNRIPISTTGPDTCSDKILVNTLAPRAFFCINNGNGFLYTTKAFAGRTSPDSDFTLQIKVSVQSFPPKDTTDSVRVTTSSVCRATATRFRKLSEGNCGNESIAAVFKSSAASNSNAPSSSYNVDIEFEPDGTVPNPVYYFAGINLKTAKQRIPLNQLGNHIIFKLKEGQTVITAKYFYVDTFASFTTPIRYAAGKTYTLSAEAYNNATGTATEYTFPLNDVEVIMVRQKDYCSQRADCTDFYSEYQQEFLATKSETESRCADPNREGYNIMYGYCQNNDAPTIRKTSYILNINTAFVKAEIIPGNAQMYVSDGNPLSYKILSVVSSNLTSGSNNNNNVISVPNGCTGSSTSTSDYFCINSDSGKIYTTSAIEGKVQISSKFTIVVRVSDTTVFPIRIVDITLELSADDKCAPASLTYSQLSTCVSYSQVQPSTNSDKNSYLFRVSTDFQVIVAVRFRLDDLGISKNAVRLSVLYDVELLNGTALELGTTPEVLISQYIEEYSSVELSIANNKMIRYVKIRFMEYRADGSNSVVSINSNVGATLVYIQDFQCKTDCSNLYSTWQEQAAIKGEACRNDPLLYRRNFDVCRDLKPEFPTENSLQLSPGYITTGGNVTISNCIYHSPYQIQASDWRQDGVVVKTTSNSRIRQRRSVLDTYPNLPGFIVEDLFLQNMKLINQGQYQCSVQEGGVPYLSGKIQLKLQDVARTKIGFILPETNWNDNYNDESSAPYKQLQADLETKMKAKLLNGDPDNLMAGVFFISKHKTNNGEFVPRVEMNIQYAGSVAVRQSYCGTITKAFLADGFGGYKVEAVDVSHLDCCVATTDGELNYKGIYTFPTTLVGQRSTHNCTYGNNGPYRPISRQCVLNPPNEPVWETFNVSFCQPKTQTTKLLIYLFQVSGSEDAVTLSRNLSIIVQEGPLTNQVDIELVTDLIGQVVSQDASSENVTLNVLDTIDGVLDTEESLLVAANENKNTSSKLLEQLDNLAAAQNATTDAKLIEKKNVGMAVVKPTPQKSLYVAAKTGNSSENIQMSVSSENTGTSGNGVDASILLPGDVVGDSKLVYSYVFKKTSLFKSNENVSIQSNIISATVFGKTIANLTGDKIEIVFDVKDAVMNETDKENTCKFFVEAVQNKSEFWSKSGCITINDPVNNKVKCQCDHLTNFAILLDVSQTGNNPLALQIITWIGCGISLAGLFLTMLTYLIFEKLRRKLPPKILISLSYSLSMVLIIFLAGAERVDPRIGCQVVAGLLQYFILSTFCWMAVEGLNLYRNFVKVFSGGASNTKFFIKASLFSWGVPAVITIATGAAKPDYLGPASENDPQFCVVRGLPFFFAVLAPVVIVLIGNMVVLVLVLRGIKDGSQLVKDSKAEKNKKLTQARIAFACSVLLGLTWVFAILAVGGARDFFQWMFCIFNSLQGFFIFVFYTLRSAECRREWKVMLGLSTLQRTSTSSRWHSKYISVYRLTHIGSVIKSRGGDKEQSSKDKDSMKDVDTSEKKSIKSKE